jgi:homoprotocatechuate degradation regulator HpaR
MSSDRGNLTLLLLSVREKVRRDFLPALRKAGLTNQQWRILRILYERGDAGINQLSNDCVIMRPSVVSIVPRLEKIGFVTREKVAGDKRRTSISLTPKGRAKVEEILPVFKDLYDRLEERLGKAELDELFAVLRKVNAKL